jgi:hypothetical protein
VQVGYIERDGLMPDGRLVLIDWKGRRGHRRDVILELDASGVPVAEIARRLGFAIRSFT